VLLEFHNSTPSIVEFVSDTPITLERVTQSVQAEHDFDEDKDAITFLDEPERYDLDEEEKEMSDVSEE
jgi:hypothetical protein